MLEGKHSLEGNAAHVNNISVLIHLQYSNARSYMNILSDVVEIIFAILDKSLFVCLA